MNNQTMLAAVRAAAHEPMSETADTSVDEGQQENNSMASSDQTPAATAVVMTKIEHEAKVAQAVADAKAAAAGETAAAVTKAKAEGKAEGAIEGATAERLRILGIESISVPGHDALIATLKADGKSTPEQAAMRILEAEKAMRGKQVQAIRDVEAEGSKVAAAAISAPGAETAPKASTPDEWKAEYARTPALQNEFISAESYAAYMAAEKAGKVKRLINRSAP